LIWHARALDVRVMHVMGWMSGLAGLVAARCLGLPIVNSSIHAAQPRLGLRERISRWCAAHSSAIVTNASACLVSYGLADHPRAIVIPNGVFLDRLKRGKRLPSESPTVCMVANFSRTKDHAILLEAMVRIRRRVSTAQLILVGRDQGTLGATRYLAESLGIGAGVRFVVDTNDPGAAIAASDVCVLATNTATHGEGMANAILEYMALGKPVVATDAGGTPELVQDGRTGLLVPGRCADALATRVLALLEQPDQARRMGEAGHRQVVECHSIDRMTLAYEAVYDRLLKRPDHSRRLAASGRTVQRPSHVRI